MKISPYIFFDGRCEEAVEFYKETLGAKVEMMMRFADSPEKAPPSLPADMITKIMHVAFHIGDTAIMASDGMCQGNSAPKFEGFCLSISVPDIATAEQTFGALAASGEVRQPLIETFFAPRFGVITDKFGVGWMVVVQA